MDKKTAKQSASRMARIADRQRDTAMNTYTLSIQVRIDAYTLQNLTVTVAAESEEAARKAYECPAVQVFNTKEVGETWPPAWEVK